MRHQTAHDRHQNIKNAIMATGPDGNSIYIDLLTITDSTEAGHAKYQIKHGNYFPANDNGRPTWDQFYIDGKDDGFPQGMQTIDDVADFIRDEIIRLHEHKTHAIISNSSKCDQGVCYERWKLVMEAWEAFNHKFTQARKAGHLIDVNAAKKMISSMYN